MANIKPFRIKKPSKPSIEFVKNFRHACEFTVEIHATNHCNLKCRGCSHYSPVAEPWFIDIEDYKNQLELLKSKITPSRIRRIGILGGEPLLHPDIDKLVLITKSIFPDASTDVVTNGILVKSLSKKTLQVMKDCNIRFVVSCYDVGIDFEELHKYLEINGISSCYIDREFFDSRLLNESKPFNPEESYRLCNTGGRFLHIRDGVIYPCSPIAYHDILNKKFGTDFIIVEDDYLKLEDLVDEEEIFKFNTTPKPYCAYCPGIKTPYKWELSKFLKEEWVEPKKGTSE